MYVRKCSYPQATVYMDCLNHYRVPFEWRIDESKDEHHIIVKSVEPGNIHSICYTFLPKEDISWDEYSSDLYVRVTEKSREIIKELNPNALLSTFIHNIEHDKWYDLPFCKDGRLASGTSMVGCIRR